jgi:hypothetical protein
MSSLIELYKKPLNAFSRSTLGPSGLVGSYYQGYTFLKSNPYSPYNSKDPVSREVLQSVSKDFKEKQEKVYNEIDKTKKQIRYNEYTRSGASQPRPHGFEYRSDYHRISGRHATKNFFKYAIVGLLVYYILIR